LQRILLENAFLQVGNIAWAIFQSTSLARSNLAQGNIIRGYLVGDNLAGSSFVGSNFF
jgi:uncharacterized protein YjbI with pentapeptide repeats